MVANAYRIKCGSGTLAITDYKLLGALQGPGGLFAMGVIHGPV